MIKITTDTVEQWLQNNDFDYKSEASARAAAQQIFERGRGSPNLKGFLEGSTLSGAEYIKKFHQPKRWKGYYNESRFTDRVISDNEKYKTDTLSRLQRAVSPTDLDRISIDENYEVSNELMREKQNLIDFLNIQQHNIDTGTNLAEFGRELDETTEFKGTKIPAGLKNVLRRQYGEIVSPRLQRRLIIPQYKEYDARVDYIKEVARSITPQRISRGETVADYDARINAEWRDIVPVGTLRSWLSAYEMKQ